MFHHYNYDSYDSYDSDIDYEYDPSDKYYSENDYNNDGHISDQEFQGAVGDFMDDYGYWSCDFLTSIKYTDYPTFSGRYCPLIKTACG